MDELFGHRMPDISDGFSEDAVIVLHSGDCLDAIKNMPRECIQLVITSPPYNVGKIYEDPRQLDEYLEGMEPILRQLVRILSPHGSLCWQVGNYVENAEVFPLDIFYYPIFKRLGLCLRNRIIWHFNHGLHASKRFSGRYETLLWFTKTQQYKFNLDAVRVPSKYPGKRHFKGPKKGLPSCNPRGKNPSDIWEIVAQDWEKELWGIPNVKSNHPEKTIHPCQFPVELVERCVLALTDEQDWVLDPFAGVGSTLIAAVMHDRRAMGCEKESEYVNITRERIHQYYQGTLRTRPLGKPIYEPSGKERVSRTPAEWGEIETEERLF